MKAAYTLIFVSLFWGISFGQVIKGSVIDKAKTKPIPFVNLLVEGTQIGTTSNDEGQFELNTSKLNTYFTLIVSAIGYKTKRVRCSKEAKNPPLLIQLEENIKELKEVVVTYLSEDEILNNFHKYYYSNYYQNSSLSNAFYHSTLSENNVHKHLLEATINIREFTKKKKRKFEVEITQRRKSNDYRTEKWNEKNNYLYDAIASNPLLELSGFLNPKNQKYYDIERMSNTTYNDDIVYVVKFTPKKDVSKPLYKAIAHFNSTDFALINANYHFDNDEQKIKPQSLKDRTYHIPYISGSVQYQKVGKYYVQKYLSYNNGWTIINNVSNDTIVKDILKDEILFTEIFFDSNTPLNSPLTRWGDIYNKPFPYDAEYWKNQTKIPNSQLFKKAVYDLEQHQSIEVQYFNNSATSVLLQEFEDSFGGRIDSLLTVYHLTGLFNGVALVTNNRKIIHHKAYGFQDIKKGIKLDTTTVFDIGSITKQFTTAIILKLRDQGRLNLDDKIGKYLPGYRYANEITIHQLLAHRSGIPTFDYQEKLNDADWFTTSMTTKEMVTSFCSEDLEFEPDSKMEYSNSNFIILTAIIEEIEHEDYFSILNRLILQPLSLQHTYSPDSLPHKNVANGYVFENNQLSPEPNWKKSNILGGGGLHSTSSDLLKWINATNSGALLNAKDRALIKSPISYYEYYDSDFGYSWGINTGMLNSGNPAYFYGGTSLGFFSMITTVPEQGINIVLLNNKGAFPRIELTNELLKMIKNTGGNRVDGSDQ